MEVMMKSPFFLCLFISLIHFTTYDMSQEIESKNAFQIPMKNMTQSEAHVSIPEIGKKVEEAYRINDNPWIQQLWTEVIKRERQFNDTHYVFYHAFANEWRLLQDLYLKLYERLHPLTMKIENFRAFRWLPFEHKMPHELIQKEMLEHGLVDDRLDHIKALLLSTNVALFGNVGVHGECSFSYFLLDNKNTKFDSKFFAEIINLFGIKINSSEYVNQMQELFNLLRPSPTDLVLGNFPEINPNFINTKNRYYPQTLSQIFIPKNLVDKVAYPTWQFGIPFEKKLAKCLTQQGKTPFESAGLRLKATDEIKSLFQDIENISPKQQKILKPIYETMAQGCYPISPLLDMYKNEPTKIPDINYLQARLILSPKYIGNIGSDIHIFDYDAIPQKNKNEYEQKLNAIVDEIVKNRLEKAAKESKKRHSLDKPYVLKPEQQPSKTKEI